MSDELFFSPAGAEGPKFALPARWSIRVRSVSGDPISLRMAIGFDETLEMLEVRTPFQFDFVASRYTALIAASTSDERISAEVWTDLYREFLLEGGFSGNSRGKLTFKPSGPIYSSAGSGF
jgi:hypothetical protein